MTLATLLDAELAFGLQPLLDRAGLTVLEGDRIGLIGRNGTGKSSLLNVIAGRVTLDEGELKRRDGLSIALVEQEPVIPVTSTLRESLAQRGGLERLTDERERWRIEARLVEYLHRFGLDEAKDPAQLSGGETKRGALALAFAQSPDLLLLDEPTNHLDIDGITLLEDLLLKAPALIVITHDRAFLDRVATRIVELDRGLLRSYPGNYSAWEGRRATELAAEETNSGRRKRRGSAAASKRAVRATRDACRGWSGCATTAARGAIGSATSSCRSTRASGRASWWPN
jgi:ATP-binding cassette subfamily F protein uup